MTMSALLPRQKDSDIRAKLNLFIHYADQFDVEISNAHIEL